MQKNLLAITGSLFLFLCLSACSSGGGGGDNGDTGDTDTDDDASQATVCTPEASVLDGTYQGCTDAASLTSANAAILYNVILGSRDNLQGNSFSSFPVVSTTVHNDTLVLCNVSGTFTLNGEQAQPGTLTTQYDNCDFGPAFFNGFASDAISVWDATSRDITRTQDTVVFRNATVDIISHGTFRLTANTVTEEESLQANLIVEDVGRTAEFQTQNLLVEASYDDLEFGIAPGNVSITLTGRQLYSEAGYVDVSTPQALFFQPANAVTPISGELLLTGVNNSTIRFTVISSTAPEVEVAIDSDGDSVVDQTFQVSWQQIIDEIDLANP